jgi:hypothetical protein
LASQVSLQKEGRRSHEVRKVMAQEEEDEEDEEKERVA